MGDQIRREARYVMSPTCVLHASSLALASASANVVV